MPNCLEKVNIRTFADNTTLFYSSNPLPVSGLMAKTDDHTQPTSEMIQLHNIWHKRDVQFITLSQM